MRGIRAFSHFPSQFSFSFLFPSPSLPKELALPVPSTTRPTSSGEKKGGNHTQKETEYQQRTIGRLFRVSYPRTCRGSRQREPALYCASTPTHAHNYSVARTWIQFSLIQFQVHLFHCLFPPTFEKREREEIYTYTYLQYERLARTKSLQGFQPRLHRRRAIYCDEGVGTGRLWYRMVGFTIFFFFFFLLFFILRASFHFI